MTRWRCGGDLYPTLLLAALAAAGALGIAPQSARAQKGPRPADGKPDVGAYEYRKT